MALDYDNLVGQILRYAQKTETDNNFYTSIPFFVNLALEKIYRDVDVLEKNIVEYGTLIATDPLLRKPNDWQSTISLYAGYLPLNDIPTNTRTPLFKRTYEFCQNWKGVAQGFPNFYADFYDDDEVDYPSFILAPIPDLNYYYELIYEATPPYLDLDNVDDTDLDASWLMQKYPSLLFYAAYIEALRYMGKPDEIPMYQGLYEQTAQSINLQNRKRNVDRTANIEKA